MNSAMASVRSIVLLLALSVHTVFEGLAVGMQDTTTKVGYMFRALTLPCLTCGVDIGT